MESIIKNFKVGKELDSKLSKATKVITRFPPEPSGYLHIGHIKAILINYIIAKKYNGKMIHSGQGHRLFPRREDRG